MGETLHPRGPSSPSDLNPVVTTQVPAPASGWSECPVKVQHHLILYLQLSELGGCQPEQPLQLFPRETGWNGKDAKELPVPACKHRSRRAGRDESGLGGSHSNTGASLQRHLPSFGMIRMGKPHWAGFSGHCTSLSSQTIQAQPGRTTN